MEAVAADCRVYRRPGDLVVVCKQQCGTSEQKKRLSKSRNGRSLRGPSSHDGGAPELVKPALAA